ncbi:tyrosine-type recombinase/integrase [Tenacibaculum sp. SG-28]|uniref:tyrosine-type recombinase/integrase n=1 Tax=Tenacibaculum sp. SG-28 TaxID=754426 RepID=UPI001E5C0E08|nr:tyrosine-type recombinase/integrase [Tenacibaculum sp. SG-28]
MKLNFSEPKIYTGGVLISEWSKLSRTQQKQALSKDWFLYYSFRDPKTKRLKRQPHIKAGVNKFKTKKERISFLMTLQKALVELLKAGFDPYQDNTELKRKFFDTEEAPAVQEIIPEPVQAPVKKVRAAKKVKARSKSKTKKAQEKTCKEAIAFAMELKQKVMNQNTWSRYRSRIGRFGIWLTENGFINQPITSIEKKDMSRYLNEVLQKTSAINRNNTRTDLSSLFQVMVDNELLQDNVIKRIPVLKTTPKRNKTYTPEMEQKLYSYLQSTDPSLYLFVQFISYNFLRPIEVCRLRVEDIDVKDKKLYVKTKNQPIKTKIIPDILLQQLPDMEGVDPKAFLFTKHGLLGSWKAQASHKRGEFTGRFRKVKDHFGLDDRYGLYSFRHTFITKLYRKIRETKTPFEAKSQLMLITGHTKMETLSHYLRDIDVELPEDYSSLLQ